MHERDLSEWDDASASDADFNRWLAERNRHRAARLGWSLIAVLVAAVVAFVFLALQTNELNRRFDASRDQVRQLNRRVEAVLVESRRDARQAEKRTECLENHVEEMAKGLRRFLQFEITSRTFLRKYHAGSGCK